MRGSGVLRVHFTAEDLARVRLAGSVDFMWEIVLSLHLLQTKELPLVFDRWRRKVADRARHPGFGETLSYLGGINPPAHYFPDFLTPPGGAGDVDTGLDMIRSTPAREFRSQLTSLAKTHAVPPLARPLTYGDADAVGFLCDALLAYYRVALAPYVPVIGRRLGRIRDSHSRRLSSGGIEELLGSLTPFRWRYPVLEADFTHDFDLHLEGRGLLLVPAFFCVRYPVKLFDPGLPPILVFPVTHDPAWLVRDPSGGCSGSLAQLIGATRAEILELVGGSQAVSAAAVSEKLHLSASVVSYHTKIMREAGLLGSDRDGPSVIHRIAPLGSALLANTPPPL